MLMTSFSIFKIDFMFLIYLYCSHKYQVYSWLLILWLIKANILKSIFTSLLGRKVLLYPTPRTLNIFLFMATPCTVQSWSRVLERFYYTPQLEHLILLCLWPLLVLCNLAQAFAPSPCYVVINNKSSSLVFDWFKLVSIPLYKCICQPSWNSDSDGFWLTIYQNICVISITLLYSKLFKPNHVSLKFWFRWYLTKNISWNTCHITYTITAHYSNQIMPLSNPDSDGIELMIYLVLSRELPPFY